MKYHKICDHCGHQITAYTFSLNASMVKALRKLVDFYETNKKPAMLEQLKLTNSQYGNFATMAHFGVIENTPEGWVPKEKGFLFIQGDITLLMPIAIMARDVLPPDHEAWKTAVRQPKAKHISQIDSLSYKQKIEYQKEKSNAGSLF